MAGWKLTPDPDRFHGLSLFCQSIAFLIHYFAFMLKSLPPSSPSPGAWAGKAPPPKCCTWIIPRVCNQYHCFSKAHRCKGQWGGWKEKRNRYKKKKKNQRMTEIWTKWIKTIRILVIPFQSLIRCFMFYKTFWNLNQKKKKKEHQKEEKRNNRLGAKERSSWCQSEKTQLRAEATKRRKKWRQGFSSVGGVS